MSYVVLSGANTGKVKVSLALNFDLESNYLGPNNIAFFCIMLKPNVKGCLYLLARRFHSFVFFFQFDSQALSGLYVSSELFIHKFQSRDWTV